MDRRGPASRLALERRHLVGAGLLPPFLLDSDAIRLQPGKLCSQSAWKEASCGLCPWSVPQLPPLVPLAVYGATLGTPPPPLSLAQYKNVFLYPVGQKLSEGWMLPRRCSGRNILK